MDYLGMLCKLELTNFLMYYLNYINENDFFDIFNRLYNKSKNEIINRISKLPINKKKYNLKQIAKKVFNDDKRELKMYYKVQTEAMMYVFEDYYNIICEYDNQKNIYNNQKFNGLLKYYSYLYGNILMLLSEIESKNGIKPIREVIIKNRVNSFETFNSSMLLKNDLNPFSPLLSFNSSVFLIRQSIELKLKNILGIDYTINTDNGNLICIPGDKLLDFVFDNPNIEIPNTLEKDIIRNIHKWTQIFIHGGFITNIWQIHIAHKILFPLFEPNYHMNTWSIYGSVKIKKYYYDNELENELISYLAKIIGNDKIKIHRLNNPEAILY